MKKIQTVSHLFYLFFRYLCWLVPILTAYLIIFHLDYLLHFGIWDSIIVLAHNKINPMSSFSIFQRILILAIQFIPLTITILIWNKLANLFLLYEKGDLFEQDNIILIRSIGLLMLLGQGMQFIYQPLMSAALTYNNPPGERIVSLTLGTANASTVLIAFIILVASWIVREAHQLKSDAQLTI